MNNKNIINPKENRLEYAKILQPPQGYEISKVLTTTYSLDMEALLGIVMALGLKIDPDKKDVLCRLRAIEKISDKLIVFCQSGKIRVPCVERTFFYSLIEDTIYPINLKDRENKSFHPKTWIIRYENKKDKKVKYKFIVMSKNLTFDRSWDLSMSMQGDIVEEQQEKNKPLEDFYKFLKNEVKLSKSKEKMMKDIINEIKYIKFEMPDRSIKDFQFMPLGIGEEYKNIGQQITKKQYEESFIISPFLSKTIVEKIYNNSVEGAKQILITRKEELIKLDKEKIPNLKIYVINDNIYNGEQNLENEENEEVDCKIQDIHAKMYLFTNKNKTEFFVGSANESVNALEENGNTEFLIKIYSNRANLNIEQFEKDLLQDEKIEYFTLTDIPKYQEKQIEEDETQKIIKQIIKLNVIANIEKSNTDTYNINVKFTEAINLTKEEISKVTIAPLMQPKNRKNISSQITFNNLNILELSEFYIIQINNKNEAVIKIETKDMPSKRVDKIISYIIKDEETFLEYLSYLLSDDAYLNLILNKSKNNENSAKGNIINSLDLYERILKMLARSPKKTKEFKTIIKDWKLENIITEDLRQFLDKFSEVIK